MFSVFSYSIFSVIMVSILHCIVFTKVSFNPGRLVTKKKLLRPRLVLVTQQQLTVSRSASRSDSTSMDHMDISFSVC